MSKVAEERGVEHGEPQAYAPREEARAHELRSVPDANIGSIFGIWLPTTFGRALQYVNGYEGGPAGFVARAGELATAYGDRSTRRPCWSRRPRPPSASPSLDGS